MYSPFSREPSNKACQPRTTGLEIESRMLQMVVNYIIAVFTDFVCILHVIVVDEAIRGDAVDEIDHGWIGFALAAVQPVITKDALKFREKSHKVRNFKISRA